MIWWFQEFIYHLVAEITKREQTVDCIGHLIELKGYPIILGFVSNGP